MLSCNTGNYLIKRQSERKHIIISVAGTVFEYHTMLILTSEAVTGGEFYDDCFCNLRNKNKIFMTPLTHSLEFSNDKRGRPLLLPNVKHLLVTHCGS